MRLFQVSDYIWRSRTFNGMRFSGVVLSTLGLLLVLVPDSCIGEVCTSCMKHIHTKPNIPPPERRGRRARRDIIRAWPSLHHCMLFTIWKITIYTYDLFILHTNDCGYVETYNLQLVTLLKFSIKPLSFCFWSTYCFRKFSITLQSTFSFFILKNAFFSPWNYFNQSWNLAFNCWEFSWYSWIVERSVINHRLSKLFETMLIVQWQIVASYLFTIWPYMIRALKWTL